MPSPNTAAISRKKVRHPYQAEYREHLEEDVVVPEATPEDPNNPSDGSDVTPLTAEEITFKDRYANLRRYHETQMNDMKSKLAELTDKVNQNNKQVVLPKSPEAIEAWRKEYPEIFDIVRTVARTEAIGERAEIDKKLEKLETDRRAVTRDRAMYQLKQIHPDIEELKASEEFHMWVQNQIPEIQSWLYDNDDDAVKAAKAVDLYKAEKGIGKKKQVDKKVDASRMVAPNSGIEPQVSNNKKVFKLSEIQRMTPRQYEKHEDEIELAREEGRLVDDLR